MIASIFSSRAAGGDNRAEALDLILLLAPVVQPGTLTDRFPQGSHLARLRPPNSSTVILTPTLFAAADPRISFDGTRVLFAGKKSSTTPWQVWEMATDGANLHQITRCLYDCLQPAYLPRDEMVYTSFTRGPASATGQLMVSKVDGSGARPITFGPGDFQVETVLKNGMILATARSPLLPESDVPADRELYTLRPDGTGLATLRCDHQHPALRRQARELDDGTVVFVEAPVTSRSLAGDLVWIRRGALQSAPLTAPPILASSPQPIADARMLLARESPGRTAAGKKLSVYAFDASTDGFTPAYEDPQFSTVEAIPVAAHRAPRWYWSTLNPALQRGYFVCLNGYLAEGAPHGRIAAKLSRVRVLTLDSCTQREILLGEAPVEDDGSFYIAVPPDRPVRFETLDPDGRVVRAQRSWIWSRSGEEHGCVGCHEDRALAPENRWPLALRRFDTPTLIGVAKRE